MVFNRLMKRFFVVPSVLLSLASCDDPTAREYLAQCKLEPGAQLQNFEHYFSSRFIYLRACMQAKGYVEDGRLAAQRGQKCGDLVSFIGSN
jgi:hypothetical protein